MSRDIAQEIIDAISSGAPDYVITQLSQERESKMDSEGLHGKVPTTETILKTAYAKVSGMAGGGSSERDSSGSEPQQQSKAEIPEVKRVDSVDDNGIVSTTVSGYDPTEYAVYNSGSISSGSSSSTGSSAGKVAGYVIIGLLGVVLLDRLLAGGGGKK